MKMTKNRLVQLFAVLCVLIVGQSMVHKVYATSENNALGYYYEIQHPDNQLTEGNAINLRMQSGQKQIIPITLISSSNQEIDLEVSLSGARTNGAGGLEYGPSDYKKDTSMKYDLPDLASVPNSVKIPAKGKKTINLEINMPKDTYDGIVTGGLRFMQKGQENSESNKDTQVKNQVALLLGVTLSMTDKTTTPTLDLRNVEAGLSNYHPSYNLGIANETPNIVRNLTLDAKITKKGDNVALYTSFKNLMQMAPNTLMNYPITLEGDAIKAGNYTAHVVMNDDNDHKWEWTKDFVVSKDQERKLNEEGVGINEEPTNWLLIIGGIVIILLLLIVIILLLKKKKK